MLLDIDAIYVKYTLKIVGRLGSKKSKSIPVGPIWSIGPVKQRSQVSMAMVYLILYITDAPSIQKIIASYAYPWFKTSPAFWLGP